MNEFQLTDDHLKKMTPGYRIATGILQNNELGIYMTDHRKGDDLRWVAVRGLGYHDWTIYVQWAEHSIDYVVEHGDKITSPNTIKRLVPCTDEAFALYRN